MNGQMNTSESTFVAEEPSALNESSNAATISGADAMRAAVEAQLLTQSVEIAQALVKSCLAGHMMAGRLLYLIAVDKIKVTAEEARKERCLANQWLPEPEWMSNSDELSSDSGNSPDAA